jgi:hypothetical protein
MRAAVLRIAGLAAVVGLSTVTMTRVARADAAGAKILASVDEAMNRAKTQSLDYEMTNVEAAGKPEKKLMITLRMKGEKLLEEFLAPADMKGTKILVLSPTQTYVYLPAFGKVRRIAEKENGDGFLGTSFSIADMMATTYSPQYDAIITSDTTAAWVLTVTPKPGQTPFYSKLVMTVAKDRNLPSELKYFNAAGVNFKTETRGGYTCEGTACAPGTRKMVDNVKVGASTTLVRKKWKVNETLSDDLFSKSNLGG